MQTQVVLTCNNCHKSDFAPFILLAEGYAVDNAAQRLWLQCLSCNALLVLAVDAAVQDQLVDLVEDDGKGIRSSDA
jgi:hypothetical protein